MSDDVIVHAMKTPATDDINVIRRCDCLWEKNKFGIRQWLTTGQYSCCIFILPPAVISVEMTMNTINARRELKRKFQARSVFGGWVSYREAAIAETFASWNGFCSHDMERTTITTDQANRIITGRASRGCPPACHDRYRITMTT